MAYTSKIQPRGLAFDTETTGCSRGEDPSLGYQICELAALVFDTDSYEIIDVLHIKIKHDPQYRWEPGAEAVHGLSQAHLAEHGVTLEDAAYAFLEFVNRWFGTDRILSLCHRSHFDISFINRMLATVDCAVHWDSVRIDTAVLGGCLLGISGSDAIFETMGFPPREQHSALEDITMTLAAAKQFREFFFQGLAA